MIQLLHELIDAQEIPSVTLYLPLQAGVAHADDNAKRLLSVLDDVEGKLQGFGLSAKGQKQFLASARTFAEDEFRNMNDGGSVGLFISPSSFHAVSLLRTDEESRVIGPRFYLTPLLPYLTSSLRYHLLSVSKGAARLFEVRSDNIEEREVEGMPKSLEDAWKGLERQEESLQFHSTGGSGNAAVFHGQGGAKDVREQEENEYMHAMAKSLHTMLREQHDPLVFAGVEELFGMYRSYDKSERLLDQYVQGNPDQLSPAELKEKADPIVKEHQKQNAERYLEEYGNVSGTGRTSVDLGAILDAAVRGKVDLLLLDEHARQWGLFNTENGKVTLHERQEEESEELLGLAASHTVAHRGRIVTMDPSKMPEGSSIAAILRY